MALWLLLPLQVSAKGDKGTAKGETVTGCLQKGTGTNDFQLKAEDGKTYDVKPAKGVALSEHVGHKVELTGKMMGASAKKGTETTGTETSAGAAANEGGTIRATAVKHLSDTCP